MPMPMTFDSHTADLEDISRKIFFGPFRSPGGGLFVAERHVFPRREIL